MFLFIKQVRRRYRLRLTLAGILAFMGLLIAVPAAAWGSPYGTSRQVTMNNDAPSTDVSSSHAAAERFLSSTETLYAAVNQGKIEELRRILVETERNFRSLPMKDIATADGIHALSHTLTELKRAVAASSPDERKWKSGAAALRLAADALAHPDKPIWHQYRNVLNEDIARIGKSMQQESSVAAPVPQSARQALQQLSEHYQLIRTAALLKSEPWKVERSDSVVRYVNRIFNADPPNLELLKGFIPPLQEAMDGLFPANKEATSAIVPPVSSPPWVWSAMMGSFIVTILTWVGWKRYRIDGYDGVHKPSKQEEPEDAAQRLLNRWKK
ncbi:sporulation protein YpjB [Cohnella silvisoli]|uniref:Sporulation protein YpjB n=1 Tax=Cohnella silvisoli TaxID=2873699 RepID=A0ABV1KN62_9BACL|nr:sporulation protein YpjB [Cohnella silvisoli]MCD9021171.1 sporulation protein YpjB [Cohnella silvisoli]